MTTMFWSWEVENNTSRVVREELDFTNERIFWRYTKNIEATQKYCRRLRLGEETCDVQEERREKNLNIETLTLNE